MFFYEGRFTDHVFDRWSKSQTLLLLIMFHVFLLLYLSLLAFCPFLVSDIHALILANFNLADPPAMLVFNLNILISHWRMTKTSSVEFLSHWKIRLEVALSFDFVFSFNKCLKVARCQAWLHWAEWALRQILLLVHRVYKLVCWSGAVTRYASFVGLSVLWGNFSAGIS